MKTIAIFDDQGVACSACACLDACGIPAILPDRHMLNVNWHLTLACGGIRLWVPECAADEALEILNHSTTIHAHTECANRRKNRLGDLIWALFAFILAGIPGPVRKIPVPDDTNGV